MENKATRKTYSLKHERAMGLARCALQLSTDTARTVTKQDTLDNLVYLLENDPAVYKKVLAIIKKQAA